MKYHHLTQLNVTDPMSMALGPALRPEAPAPAPCPVAAFERGDHGSAKGLPSVAEARERFGFATEPKFKAGDLVKPGPAWRAISQPASRVLTAVGVLPGGRVRFISDLGEWEAPLEWLRLAEPADPMAEFTQGILRRMAEALGVDPDLLAEAEPAVTPLQS